MIVGREISLEFFDKWPARKGAAVNHLADRAIKLTSERRVMRVKIEKRNSNVHFFLGRLSQCGAGVLRCGYLVTDLAIAELYKLVKVDVAPQVYIGPNRPMSDSFAIHAPAISAAFRALRPFVAWKTGAPLAEDCGKITGPPFALSEAEAASRILTSSSPCRPLVTGSVFFSMQSTKC